MNWEAIGAVGEIIGAMAVVLSLIYLAIQVRQNSTMARAESRLRLVATWREFTDSLESGDVYAFGRGLQHYPELPPAEIVKFRGHLYHMLHFFQCALALREAQTLDEDTYSRYATIIAALYATPGGRRFWQEAKIFATGRIAQALDDRLTEGQFPDIRTTFLMPVNEDKATADTQENSH
jgi:hypothetical protein